MINYLKDCQKSTPIGMLPDIINHNNTAIKNEFNWIFDSSLNRITKSVYVPTGSVKAHFGEFVNLSCEYITIKNVDSLKNSIFSAVDEIIRDGATDHKVLKNRYSTEGAEKIYGDSFAHDANYIAFNSTTVSDELTAINNNINNVNSNIETINSSIATINNTVNDLSTNIKDVSLSAGTNIQIQNKTISALGYTSNQTSFNVDTKDVVFGYDNGKSVTVSSLSELIKNMQAQIDALSNQLAAANEALAALSGEPQN